MRRFILILVLALSQAACSMDALPFVYKMDVRQGNHITQEMVDALRAGMTRRQVEFLLGSPLLETPFATNRWDYVYTLKPGHGDMRKKQLTVFFEGDRLVGIEGDFEAQDPALRASGGEA